MAEQPKQTSAMELASPEELPAARTAARAALAAGLSPWERHKLEWQMRRERGQLVKKLADVEMQTLVAEAIQRGEQRMDIAQERALLAVFEEQAACLVQVGKLRDAAIIEALKLTVGSRELIADAIDRVTGGYVDRMERRARGAP